MVKPAGKATDLITQNVVMVKESEKMSQLQKTILRDLGDKKAIVFCNTRKAADMRTKDLENAGFPCHDHTWMEVKRAREVPALMILETGTAIFLSLPIY